MQEIVKRYSNRIFIYLNKNYLQIDCERAFFSVWENVEKRGDFPLFFGGYMHCVIVNFPV